MHWRPDRRFAAAMAVTPALAFQWVGDLTPGYAAALSWAGIDAVNLANNHAFDFGGSGQAQTFAALRRAQVRWTGRPGQVTIIEFNGVRAALLGFAPYPWASPLLEIGKARK